MLAFHKNKKNKKSYVNIYKYASKAMKKFSPPPKETTIEKKLRSDAFKYILLSAELSSIFSLHKALLQCMDVEW